MRKFSFIFCFVILLSSIAFAQKKGKKLTYGSIKDSTYVNAFFDLKIDIPHGWAIQSQEQNEKLKERGKDFIDAEGNQEVILDAAVNRSAILLTTSQYEAGAPVNFNGSLILVVENIELSPGVKNGSDYLFHSKNIMENHSKLNYKIEPDFKPVKIGGKQFYEMASSLENGNKIIGQKIYATIIKDYAFVIILTEDKSSPVSEFDTLLNEGIKFMD